MCNFGVDDSNVRKISKEKCVRTYDEKETSKLYIFTDCVTDGTGECGFDCAVSAGG